MTTGLKFSKTLSKTRLTLVCSMLYLSGCSTAPKLDYTQEDYREVIYQITYDFLRAAECRHVESFQAYRPCDHSYFRDFEHYRRVRSDFMNDTAASEKRPF
jgi:hypothetical protein